MRFADGDDGMTGSGTGHITSLFDLMPSYRQGHSNLEIKKSDKSGCIISFEFRSYIFQQSNLFLFTLVA